MARIPQTHLRELQERLSIVELVGQYVQPSTRTWGPLGSVSFHNEKSASFKVNEARKAYKCFGCGKGGGLINFFMELEGLQFREAVEEPVADQHEDARGRSDSRAAKSTQPEERLYEANHSLVPTSSKSSLALKRSGPRRVWPPGHPARARPEVQPEWLPTPTV